MLPQVEVKILDERIGVDESLPLPQRATVGSAGIDLRACISEPITLKAGETQLIGTGLAIFIADPDYVGLIYPRSGLGHKHGVVLGNLTGVIDADYQGELKISLWNRSEQDYVVQIGERIAQYVIAPIQRPELKIVSDFSDVSDRGAGGFGHSGKH